jgi:hypothetical protein
MDNATGSRGELGQQRCEVVWDGGYTHIQYNNMVRVPAIVYRRNSLRCGETDGGSQIRVRDVCVTPPLSLG